MNIMEIVSGSGVNGVVIHCLSLVEELIGRGHDVTLVCLPDSWIEREVTNRAIPVAIVRSDLHRWPVDELRRVAAVARQRRIDILHTHMSRAHFFGVLLRWFSGIPSVATAHSSHFQLHWMFNDSVIANSEATRRYHRRRNLVRSRRIETIRMFIDRRHLEEVSPGARAEARRLLDLDDGSPLLAILGNVCVRKGALYAVRAMPKILGEFPNARLAIVGRPFDADYINLAKADAQRLRVDSQILWVGHCDDVRAILRAIDVYLQPSLDEPLGLSILEAMATGLPVVASSVGGIPEIVVSGETGILVPPADSEELAGAILSLLRDPARRREYGTAGRRRVLEEFSPASQMPRIEAAFARTAHYRRAA